MKYYFIYSAGGGAGDWNGIKRVWKSSMPEKIKQNILLKFGDIFFNHKSSSSILRSERWNNIKDIRKWLYDNVNDEYVIDNSNILLDSGTAKIVSFIDHNYNLGELDTNQVIQYFRKIIEENNILEKYADVIIESNINYAVTFDVPDPFKVRSNNNVVESRRNILESDKVIELMNVSIEYTNRLFNILKEKIGEDKAINILMPIVNGNWTKNQYDRFIDKLIFKPKNIAIGGISGREVNINELQLIEFNLEQFKKVHFLGCGGLTKTELLRKIYNGKMYSVDVSTPINRAIDGAVSGSAYSGVYSYNDFRLMRICKENKEMIVNDYAKCSVDKIFPDDEFEKIIDKIIEHQSGKSNEETYNSRAKIIILNSDVFRYNAEL